MHQLLSLDFVLGQPGLSGREAVTQIFHLNADAGLVTLRDQSLALPQDVILDPDRRELRRLAEKGEVFYLDGEDPLELRVALYLGDQEVDVPSHSFERMGGSFHLALPTGRLVLAESHELDLAPGDYSVSVLGRAVVDGPAMERDRRSALSAEDWRYRKGVERLSMMGCVPFLAAWIVVFVYELSFVSLAAVVITLIAAAPGYLLSKSKRYRKTESSLLEYDRLLPHYVLHLRSLSNAEGVAGGHLMI